MQLTYLLLFAFLYFPHEISGARILAMFSFPGKSNWNFYHPYLLGLAANGHKLTVVGHYPQNRSIPGYKDISLAGTFNNLDNNLNIQELIAYDRFKFLPLLWELHGYRTCEDLYNTKQIQNLAKSKAKYDLLITDLFGGDCFHPFAHKFNIPLVGITSGPILPYGADFINLPDNPSYIPNAVVPFGNNMNFIQRLFNAITLMALKFGYHYVSRQNTDRLARQLFPDMPPLLEISNDISLVISNTHFSLDGAKPGVPALVEAAGMHINPIPRILPLHLSRVLDESDNGVVFFSFGSLVKSETLPPRVLRAFLSVFRRLNETVLWKVDGSLIDNLPPNVVTSSWVPQREVLCHPNVKVFITHGGILGSQEAIHCGVPMVGIPLFGDQYHNVRNFEARGFARYLDVESITETSLRYALITVMDSPKYKWNAKRISRLFRDRPYEPLEEAIYWTEYVITQEGAYHLRTSASYLNWFQYLLLDVLAAVCLGFILTVAGIVIFIKLIAQDPYKPPVPPVIIETPSVPVIKKKVQKRNTYFT